MLTIPISRIRMKLNFLYLSTHDPLAIKYTFLGESKGKWRGSLKRHVLVIFYANTGNTTALLINTVQVNWV